MTYLTIFDERWLNAKIITYFSIDPYLSRTNPRKKKIEFNDIRVNLHIISSFKDPQQTLHKKNIIKWILQD
jgi:hypothetical protein